MSVHGLIELFHRLGKYLLILYLLEQGGPEDMQFGKLSQLYFIVFTKSK